MSLNAEVEQLTAEARPLTVETVQDEFFGLHIPTECPGVPTEALHPKKTWTDKDRYDQQAQDLAKKFHENFKQLDHVTKDIAEAGPTFRG
uniref:hypothetical protein n=1 Tax=uncultured Allobacillus sp. TaxID=1638025 RepID=UPI002595BEA0|nr:hypothetical protein [uncultured Allobacillus sp.]